MAFYSSNYYEAGDLGEYSLTPYADIHDHHASLDQGPTSYYYSSHEPPTQNSYYHSSHEPPTQNSYYYSSHEPPTQNLFQYDPTPSQYYYACQNSYTKPLSINYYPNVYNPSYDAEVTQFMISYSVSSKFNELEFEEYDPTPYGGGFDIVQTYGKPLSPSLETCYPRSSGPAALNPPSLEGVTDGSIVPLSGKQEPSQQAPKPINGSQPMQAVEEEKQHQERREDQRSQVEESPNQVEESEEVVQGSYEHGQEVYNQVPSGYGLEAMDICESLFGYWPCLARDFKRGNGNGDSCYEFGSGEGRYGNPWKGTADYLFGSSNPYGEIRDEGSNYLQ
ncbi:hypothetical protein ACFX15_036210 [Malus domestica]